MRRGWGWRVELPDEALAVPPYGGVIVLAGVRSDAAGAPMRANR